MQVNMNIFLFLLSLSLWTFLVNSQTCNLKLVVIEDSDLACFKKFRQMMQNFDVTIDADCEKIAKEKNFSHPDYSSWHTIKVRNEFKELFANSEENPNVEFWDVSRALTLEDMFYNAKNFNRSLHRWKFRSVKNFDRFLYGTAYNGPIEIVAPAATSFRGMLAHTPNFNQRVDIDCHKNADFTSMLENASSFNNEITISKLSTATSLNYFLYEASAFNQPLKWTYILNKDASVRQVLGKNPSMTWDVSCWPTPFEIGDVETKCNPENLNVTYDSCEKCFFEPVEDSDPFASRNMLALMFVSIVTLFVSTGQYLN